MHDDEEWLTLGALALFVLRAMSVGRALDQMPPGGAQTAPVALVGDSLAVGLAGPLQRAAEGAGRRFRSSARVGATTAGLLAGGWATSAVLPGAVAVVSLGTNDAVAELGPQLARNMAAVVARLRQAGAARVVWLLPPPMPPRLVGDAAMRGAVRSLGVPVVDGAELEGLARAPDGVHLTPAGYAAWSRAVWAAVR